MPNVEEQAYEVQTVQLEDGRQPMELNHVKLTEAPYQEQEKQVQNLDPQISQNVLREPQRENQLETCNDQNIVSPISMISPQ